MMNYFVSCDDENPAGDNTLPADSDSQPELEDFPESDSCSDAELTFQISPDRMSATITEYIPAVGDGVALDQKRLRDLLFAADISVDPDNEAVLELFKRLKLNRPIKGIVIAKGTLPKHGEDGRIEFCFDTSNSVGTVDEEGRIDFYERNTVQSVVKGDPLGRLVGPTEGTSGFDLFGNTIHANKGRPAALKADKSVIVSDDGLALFSGVDGMVTYSGDTLSVSDVAEIASDIDFATGNIHMESGSVSIRGTVRSGFEVTAQGNVVVSETVEDAKIVAGGNIEVQKGLIMNEQGHLKAGENVTCRFARNARIDSGGNVTIANSATNCHIVAKGKVVLTGAKGRIQGGSTQSRGSIEAYEIGSDSEVSTHIEIVSQNYDVLIELMEEKRRLEVKEAKLNRMYGNGEDSEILERIEPDLRTIAKKHLKMRKIGHQRIAEIKGLIEIQEENCTKQESQLRVKVRGSVHPGASIMIFGCLFTVSELLAACQFYHDTETNSVQCMPL